MSRASITPQNLRRQARRRMTRRAGIAAVLSVATLGATGAMVASAAVPTVDEGNLVVFPNRDFITVEGFQDHVGETATVEVSRGDQVIGSAKSEVAAGEVAFEINHPGGACWGAGTDLKVTPDIRGNDKVTIKFEDGTSYDTTVQDVEVGRVTYADGATSYNVSGRIGPGVSAARLEARVINPDLTDTFVGRRDLRAVPPADLAPGRDGYLSGLAVSGPDNSERTYTATYDFGAEGAEVAKLAATGGGERIMSWQVEDGDGNRQGLTIAESGEPGGPGMGGCPAGPTDQGAPAPGKASVIRSTDKKSIQVTWTPATAAPGATPVDGYSVVAIEKTTGAQQKQVGVRTTKDETRTTIDGLNENLDYDVEVRSLAGSKMSDALAIAAPVPQEPPTGGDVTKPTVTADPAPGADGAIVEAAEVKLTSEDADVYYTTGDTAVILADMPSAEAKLYTAPIKITEQTKINFVAFDRAGNHSDVQSATYKPKPVAAPTAAPTLGASAGGQRQVTLRWNATEDASVTGYDVQLYSDATGTTPAGGERDSTARTLTIGDLAPGTYTFKVRAKNGGGPGPWSTLSQPLEVTAVTDRVTIGTARWKAGDFRVSGTSTLVGTRITVHIGTPDAPALANLSVATTAAAAPATGGEYSIRFRNGQAPTTRPTAIYVKSSGNSTLAGGIAGPVAATNG